MPLPTEPSMTPDVEALTSFYDGAVREVFRYLYRATAGDRDLAEELTSESFLAVVRAARDGRREALTVPWVIGVARHKLVDHYRRRSREERKLSLAWRDDTEDDAALTWLASCSAEQAHALLANLSPDHRLALVLRYLDELPVASVAEQLGRSVHATESLLVRARHALAVQHRERADD